MQQVMFLVWWDCKGVIMFELFQTIMAELYCNKLDHLVIQIQQKHLYHGPVHFLHNNARPHTAALTHQKLFDLGWEILIHLPYSPDLASSDFLFISIYSYP